MTEKKYLIAVCAFIPFGSARVRLLLRYFKSAKNIWQASSKELVQLGLRKKTVESFVEHRTNFDDVGYFARLKKLGVGCLSYTDKNYPANLQDLEDAPYVVYCRGRLKAADSNAVAIVGSRKMTGYGREVTEKLATELAAVGVTIISGLAFGVDAAAHKAALVAGGRCIAVLASGVDSVTPKSNVWLASDIVRKNQGAIISEFPLGTQPQKSFFPYRNRIISGLAKAVIVIEGMQKSGTIHTAHHAAKQGREVFAVPGQITSPMSAAPHYLIKNGAKMITQVGDVLEELDMQLKVDADAIEKVLPTDATEAKILTILANEPLHLDELARMSGLQAKDISARLTVMELKGMVKNIGSGVYKKL